MNIFLICLGGSLGALSRFYLSSLFQKSENFEIPLGILVVNISGCFLLGLFYHLMDSSLERYLTPFLFIGFLGAFTTFSAEKVVKAPKNPMKRNGVKYLSRLESIR